MGVKVNGLREIKIFSSVVTGGAARSETTSEGIGIHNIATAHNPAKAQLPR
jgi:hypothetical protein